MKNILFRNKSEVFINNIVCHEIQFTLIEKLPSQAPQLGNPWIYPSTGSPYVGPYVTTTSGTITVNGNTSTLNGNSTYVYASNSGSVNKNNDLYTNCDNVSFTVPVNYFGTLEESKALTVS